MSESLELVIAGDFVDFLAIEPQARFTPDPVEARAKLEQTMGDERFRAVFDALGKLVHASHHLTVLVGNHDVEMALPTVQDALLARLGAPWRMRFVDDERAYRIGGALIEHGNAYDGANANDWPGLARLVAAQSRWQASDRELEVSAGSALVEKVINPLKERYPFIDLLQEQGELTLLLVLAFEPQLLRRFGLLARFVRPYLLQSERQLVRLVGKALPIAHRPGAGGPAPYSAGADADLEAAFGDSYRQLRQTSPAPVGIGDLAAITWRERKDSLSAILERGDPIPADRLHKLRAVMRRLVDERLFAPDSEDGLYGRAAEGMIQRADGGLDVVVMGHTHLARSRGPAERPWYINTGTWADIVRVPTAALADGADDTLTDFLHRLWRGERPGNPAPTYAELCIEPGGWVSRAALRSWEP